MCMDFGCPTAVLGTFRSQVGGTFHSVLLVGGLVRFYRRSCQWPAYMLYDMGTGKGNRSAVFVEPMFP